MEEIEKYILENKIIAFFGDFKGEFVDTVNNYPNITVKKYILKSTSCFDKKLYDSLKFVELDKEILDRNVQVLSTSEKLKIELAIKLIENEKVIVLNDFSKNFMVKELFFFKKLFKKIVSKYNKTIVFINSDLDFLFDMASRIVIKNNKKFIVIDNPSFYEEELKSLDNYPPILEFVDYLEKCGRKIKGYIDTKELLKAIFREV